MKQMKISIFIILVGILVGCLDGVSAIILNREIGYEKVFRYIASGAFGSRAFEQESLMVFWGIFFHFIIALFWSFIFVQGFQFFRIISSNFIILGVVFGICIWLIMNFIVIPLSLTPKIPFDLKPTLIQLAIHIICIGLPITFLTSKYNISRHNK